LKKILSITLLSLFIALAGCATIQAQEPQKPAQQPAKAEPTEAQLWEIREFRKLRYEMDLHKAQQSAKAFEEAQQALKEFYAKPGVKK